MQNKTFYYAIILLSLFAFSIISNIYCYEKTQLICKCLIEDYEDIHSSLQHEEQLLREMLTGGNPMNIGVHNGSEGLKILNSEFALSNVNRKKSDIYKSVKLLFESNFVICPSIIPYQPDALQIRLNACIRWSIKLEKLIEECQVSSKDLTWAQYEKYSILKDYHYNESLQYFRWAHEVSLFGVNGDIKKHIDNVFLSIPLLIAQGTPSGNIQGFITQVFVHYSLNVIDNYFLIEGLSMRAAHHLDLYYFYKEVIRYG